MYDPRAIPTRDDVVVVTINYRLGAFGFLHVDELCGSDLGVCGNAGILDQLAALNGCWLQARFRSRRPPKTWMSEATSPTWS